MTQTADSLPWIVTALVVVIGVLMTVVGFLASRWINRQEGKQERVETDQVKTLVDQTKIARDVELLMSERPKCEALDREVAVLKERSVRAELKLDEFDRVSLEVREMKSDVAHMSSALDELKATLPETVANALALRLPPMILEILEGRRAAAGTLRQVVNNG